MSWCTALDFLSTGAKLHYFSQPLLTLVSKDHSKHGAYTVKALLGDYGYFLCFSYNM